MRVLRTQVFSLLATDPQVEGTDRILSIRGGKGKAASKGANIIRCKNLYPLDSQWRDPLPSDLADAAGQPIWHAAAKLARNADWSASPPIKPS